MFNKQTVTTNKVTSNKNRR